MLTMSYVSIGLLQYVKLCNVKSDNERHTSNNDDHWYNVLFTKMLHVRC